MPSESSQNPDKMAGLLTENRDMLRAFLYGHLRNWNETEDLFQEVWLVIVRKADTAMEVRNFKAWCREIARRTLLDYWKRKKKQPVLMDDDALSALEAAWQRRDRLEESDSTLVEMLRKCLRTLSANLRHLLQLRYECEFSLKQIAEATGRTEVAVQVALSRTRTALRRCVQTNVANK